MKNQYVGDINDFRKYGLIRTLLGNDRLTAGVFWLLTPDDGRQDGSRLQYLNNGNHEGTLDPVLFSKLHNAVHTRRERSVAIIEDMGLLPRTRFVSDLIPDNATGRSTVFRAGMAQLANCDLIFFDPDNGLEVKSKQLGSKGSNKYLYLNEVESAFHRGHSLLIYQHFPREKRPQYIAKRVLQLRQKTSNAVIFSIATDHVCFFLVAQPRHLRDFQIQVETLRSKWSSAFSANVHHQ